MTTNKDEAIARAIARRRLFGKALETVRRVRGIAQVDLGQRIGVTQATISSWESGTTEPTPLQVFALEDALGAIKLLGNDHLSQHLGYRRIASKGESTDDSRCAADYFANDPDLERDKLAILLAFYTLLQELSVKDN